MFMLHPQLARDAAAREQIDPARNGDWPEVVLLTNATGHTLAGWVFASPTNHGVVLVGDGNATGIAQTYAYNRHLLHLGFNVVFLSYQGFDANPGKASLTSLPTDIEAFYVFCTRRFPQQPVALVGESLSAGALFCFSSRHPQVACQVLEGTVDLKTVAFTRLKRSWILCLLSPITWPTALTISATVPDELSARRALQRHPVMPALFIHHPQDPETPYRDALRIFENYGGPKELINPRIETGQDFHMTGNFDPEVRARVIRFLKRNLRSSAGDEHP